MCVTHWKETPHTSAMSFQSTKYPSNVFLVLPQHVPLSSPSLCSTYFTNGLCFHFPTGFHANVSLTRSHANATLSQRPLQTFVLQPSAQSTSSVCVSDFVRWPGYLSALLVCVCACLCVRACVRVFPSSSIHLWRDLISLWHGLNFPLCGTRKPLPSSGSVNGVWGRSESLDP